MPRPTAIQQDLGEKQHPNEGLRLGAQSADAQIFGPRGPTFTQHRHPLQQLLQLQRRLSRWWYLHFRCISSITTWHFIAEYSHKLFKWETGWGAKKSSHFPAVYLNSEQVLPGFALQMIQAFLFSPRKIRGLAVSSPNSTAEWALIYSCEYSLKKKTLGSCLRGKRRDVG